MLAISLVAASLLPLGLASPVSSNFVVRDSLNSVPKGYVDNGPASGSTVLDLRIALTSNNIQGLEKALYDVSTPSSPNYRKYLTKEQAGKFVAPSSTTATMVEEWLSSHGLKATHDTPAGEWLRLSVDVQKANELLNAKFGVFTHAVSGKRSIRTLSYSIPESLRDHVQAIHPTTFFPDTEFGLPIISTPVPKKNSSSAAKNSSTAAVDPSCATQVTPACLESQYGIPTTPATNPSNQLGVSGFIGQFAQAADLTTFLQTFRPDMDSTITFSLQTLDGGTNPQDPSQAGLEANLDIQYTIGVATNVPTTFISVGSQNTDGISGFLDIINFLLSESSPPQVLSTSYGFNEPGVPSDLANQVCNAYMQLGALGVSILFSSGDGGVSGSQNQQCTTFVPTFPSGCPFITSIGGTTGISPETSASLSAGGFSNIFPRPSYQDAAVAAYLSQLGDTNSGLFNPNGRGYPDISAQAQNVPIFNGGSEISVAGTSCSAPITASIIALLNDKLASVGQPPLGFLNPFLYSNGASAFTDITTGSNPGCGTNGFPAASGWDPVTGFGSPNFAALSSLLGV